MDEKSHMCSTLFVYNRNKRIPAGSKISIASINAEPIIPNISLTPWATMVSTKASLGVMRDIFYSYMILG